MAAKNLAVVDDGEILVYSDPLNLSSLVIARIPLGSRRSIEAYTMALNTKGWRATEPWGWQERTDGAVPAVSVERI